ncbi:MAG: dockerin type I repeat-containing protein [Clostridia bacterium]|nr:dockerin type I repeat-containing protein [Clostridia bacterium]
MRKLLCILLVFLIVSASLSCFAKQSSEFDVLQAVALYSATENGNTISIAQDGVSVSGRSVTVSFSSDKLVRGSSQLTVVAYKPEGVDATPTKENIYYINQVVYNNDSFTFPISSQAPIGTYVLLLGGDDFSAAARVTFPLGIDAELVIGDVNNDSVLNTLDIIKLKNYLANVEDVTRLWTDRDNYVADYNKDFVVNLLDVAAMKETIANRTFSE